MLYPHENQPICGSRATFGKLCSEALRAYRLVVREPALVYVAVAALVASVATAVMMLLAPSDVLVVIMLTVDMTTWLVSINCCVVVPPPPIIGAELALYASSRSSISFFMLLHPRGLRLTDILNR